MGDAGALRDLSARLARAPRIALDTEAASFHRYADRVYLVQVSSDLETALIDPLAVPDLSPLGELLANDQLEVVFHDADYDLRVLDRDYGFRARHVFDTRIAAQLLGEPAVGLAALLERHFGVILDKRLQRADWSVRPLTTDMIAYAAADTMYLPRLRDTLADRLRSSGRIAWAEEEFLHLEAVRWTVAPAENGWLRIKGARVLPRRSQAVLRALHDWREQTARALDRAPFRVMQNEALLAVARASPRSTSELATVRGLPAPLARRYGAQLLAAVEMGLADPLDGLPDPPRASRARPDAAEEARLERLKTLRNQRATELGMEPGVLCPNGTLQAIARSAPRTQAELESIEEIRRWQVAALGGAAILAAAAEPAATQ